MRKAIVTALACAALTGCVGDNQNIDDCSAERHPGAIFIVENGLVFFDAGSAVLNQRAAAYLDKRKPAIWLSCVDRVDITGHTDRSGSSSDNLNLSLRRAEAVREALIARGVSKAVLVVRGIGEDDPLIPTADGVVEPQNNFVEIVPR